MLDMLHSELFRLSRHAMPKVLLAVLAVVVAMVYFLSWAAAQSGQFSASEQADLLDALELSSALETGLGFAGTFGALFVIVLAASLAATEYAWGTIRTLLPRGPGRAPFLAAKLVVLAVFALLVVIVSLVAALASSVVVTAIEDLDRSLGSGFAPDALLGIGRAWFVTLPYLALAFMVALLARSSAAGISVAVTMLFLEGQILSLVAAAGGFLERLPGLFPSRNVEAILALNEVDAATRDLPGPWQATLVLTLYVAGFLVLAFWRFHRRDVTVG
jgi:ABC-2 type transport system permease protein